MKLKLLFLGLYLGFCFQVQAGQNGGTKNALVDDIQSLLEQLEEFKKRVEQLQKTNQQLQEATQQQAKDIQQLRMNKKNSKVGRDQR